MKTIVTGVFDEIPAAASAVRALVAAGHDPKHISCVLPNPETEGVAGMTEDQGRAIVDANALHPSGAARLGALMGASGMALGATLLLPGLIAVGSIGALLVGAGSGALAGGFLGGLIGSGISRDLAEVYHRSIERGSVMVGVEAHLDQHQIVRDLLERHGARALTEIAFG